ncbi:hypothetical protein [Desulfobulbus propionicus]|jgi:hypothetical protein
MNSMEEMLSLEVKKEIADRYFGFRKMIEDDSREYTEHIHQAYRQLENEVGFDLVRLYILLHRESLIHDFYRITGFRDPVFLDPHLLQSANVRRRLFKGQQIRGFTRHARFIHLFFDIYQRLQKGLEAYNATMNRLVREGQAIAEEIELFYRKNDLSSMMGFLRRLDSGGNAGPMGGELAPFRDTLLEEKMRIQAPNTAETLLPAFPPLPPLKTCKGQLTDLLDRAYSMQEQPEVQHYGR